MSKDTKLIIYKLFDSYIVEKSNNFRTTKPMVRNGIKNGLQILLDAETYDYGSSPNGGEGFILSILHHLDIPIMKNSGININTGQCNNLVVSATLMNTSEAVRNRFSPQQRNCYFEDEIQLLHLPQDNSFRYEISNCLFEATLQKIEENCHCVPAYFQDTVPEVPVCTGSSINCMKQLKEEMGSIKHINDEGKYGTVLEFSDLFGLFKAFRICLNLLWLNT